MIDRDELAAWLRLIETPRVGRESARRLLAAFGSAQAVFEASGAALLEAVGPAAAAAMSAEHEPLAALVATTWDWLHAESPERRAVITLGDPAYPQSLLETADPPLLLYLQGRAELLQADAVAVVGSRNPTPQGIDNARTFAESLSLAGWTVVSGLALGIDAAAHEGGLDGGSGTVAVVGTGLDRVYPRRNLKLAHRIAEQGLMVSEYALGTPPLAQNFPIRNRIIAGLAQGTLVVEAALQSGSLITARLAIEAGRDVFAIPGSIHSPQARGCHALIKQGAKLVDSAQDVLEELNPSGLSPDVVHGADVPGHDNPADAPASAAQDEDPLLAVMGFDPITLDGLVARTGMSTSALNIRLLELELDGRVARLPGQLFQRLSQG